MRTSAALEIHYLADAAARVGVRAAADGVEATDCLVGIESSYRRLSVLRTSSAGRGESVASTAAATAIRGVRRPSLTLPRCTIGRLFASSSSVGDGNWACSLRSEVLARLRVGGDLQRELGPLLLPLSCDGSQAIRSHPRRVTGPLPPSVAVPSPVGRLARRLGSASDRRPL